jgi:hypothetical protein
MATFGDILTKVVKRLKDPNNVEISSSDVATVINDAIQHWSKIRFWFNEFQDTVTLTANDPVLPTLSVTPLYLFQQGGITINYAQTRWPLKPVSSLEYDEMNVQGQGIPFAYTERNGGYELYYYPDAAYSAVVRGVKAYEEFATDGSENSQSNDFTTNAADLIIYEALARLFGEIKQDPKMESYYANRAMNEKLSLMKQTNRRKSTGRIAVEGF